MIRISVKQGVQQGSLFNPLISATASKKIYFFLTIKIVIFVKGNQIKESFLGSLINVTIGS